MTTYPRNLHLARPLADAPGLSALMLAEAEAAAAAKAAPHDDEAWAALTAARQATSAYSGAYNQRAQPDL